MIKKFKEHREDQKSRICTKQFRKRDALQTKNIQQYSSSHEGEIRAFTDKQKLKEFSNTNINPPSTCPNQREKYAQRINQEIYEPIKEQNGNIQIVTITLNVNGMN